MSALLTVVPMDSKPAKARCADCIRDTDGEMASPCKRHRRKYDGHGVAALSEEQVVAFLSRSAIGCTGQRNISARVWSRFENFRSVAAAP